MGRFAGPGSTQRNTLPNIFAITFLLTPLQTASMMNSATSHISDITEIYGKISFTLGDKLP